MYVPKEIFLTKGVGKHKEKLASFEMALRNARIAAFNIVEVSSIFPPHCKMISADAGLKKLLDGQILHVVMSRNSTNEPNRLIAASVGVAIPSDRNAYGYLSEHHSFGEKESRAGDYAEDLAATMLDARKEFWKISGKIVRTRNITQSAIGDKNGLWTTVVAAAVLLPNLD